jgi:hypothetical protein
MGWVTGKTGMDLSPWQLHETVDDNRFPSHYRGNDVVSRQ